MRTEKKHQPQKPRLRAHQTSRLCTGISRRVAFLSVLAGLAACALPAFADRLDVGGKRSFSCYTANAYVGADLTPAIVLDPSDPNYLMELVAAVTGIYTHIVASEPPVRLAALADEIATARPDIASVVEMWTLSKAPATSQGPGPFTVVFDFLPLLTQALDARGAHYEVVVVSTETDIAMPMLDPQTGALAYGRLTDHEAILVRTDLPPGYLRVANPQTGRFAHYLQIPGVVSLYRGWCSVDVFTRGERFRYIATHLEEETLPDLQMVQGLELLSGPANVAPPVIITGDFNADPLHRNGTTTYDAFTQAGFQDAWAALNPNDLAGGLTWGHDALLADPNIAFSWRIDLVLYRGAEFSPATVQVLDPPLNAAAPPLWPSDHAAVTASFSLGHTK
jgi:hypothetical protein